MLTLSRKSSGSGSVEEEQGNVGQGLITDNLRLVITGLSLTLLQLVNNLKPGKVNVDESLYSQEHGRI